MTERHEKYVQRILDPARFDHRTADPKSGILAPRPGSHLNFLKKCKISD